MKQAVDQQIIRKTNQHLILQTVLAYDSVTRAFLAQRLSLSPPSVSHNVDVLLDRGILVQTGVDSQSKRGRKGIILEFNKAEYYIIGVDLSTTQLRIGLSNMYEEIIDILDLDGLEELEGEMICEKIITTIKQLIESHQIDPSLLRVIVVATPGVINKNTGVMQFVPQIRGWENINLKQELEAAFDASIVIENDVNVVALGEANYGMAKGYSDFIHLNIDLGVGGSLILGGKLYTGVNFAGGELGFMGFDYHSLGKKHQENFESLVCLPTIRRRFASALKLVEKDVTIDLINKLYAQGNEIAIKEIDRLARYISLAVINMVSLLDVGKIVIGGAITKFEVQLIEKIQAYVSGAVPFMPEIVFSPLGNQSCLRGAFAMGVERVIKELVG